MQYLRSLPQLLAGKVSDPTNAVQGLLGAVGLQALALVKEAYITKARGGTDEAGISWQPLKPKTVAYGRRHAGLRRKGNGKRPLLTAAQDKLWRGVFARAYRRLNAKGDKDAAGNAAALAWAVVKRQGGKTILGEYGGTKVEIGRDTGRLLNSLSPGTAPMPTSGDQVLRVETGSVAVGTRVPYAEAFHRKRPLWPDESRIPDAWWQRIGQTIAEGIGNLLRRAGNG